jgi:hypothetical protein
MHGEAVGGHQAMAERLRAAQEGPRAPTPSVTPGSPQLPQQATGPTAESQLEPPLPVTAVLEVVQYEEVCA